MAPRGIRFEPLAGDTLNRLLDRKTAKIDALPTPYPSWNAICGEEGGRVGLAKHWVCVIGGVTGSGKSYLASNLAAESVLQGRKVGMVNFEMTQMAVATRYLAILSGLPKWRLEMGKNFSTEHWLKAKKVADDLLSQSGGAMVANESSVFSLADIEESYVRLVDAGVEQVIIDYAQLVTVNGAEGIYQRSEKVATRLRELTHEHPVQTIALSQFNREEAKRNKPPSIHGLMGGGIWEHAANQIWLLDHTLRLKYHKDGHPKGEYTKILCGKNRHGIAPVEIPMKWSYETMRFDEYNPGTDPGDPFVGGDDSVDRLAAEIDALADKDEQDDTHDMFDF